MASVETLRGRIQDLDSHEMIPAKLWPEYFGDIGAMLHSMLESRINVMEGANNFYVDVDGDDTPITDETVWTVKGPKAPGAIDMARRLDVLDVMGVRRQLVFPGFGLVGVVVCQASLDFLAGLFEVEASTLDAPMVREFGRAMCMAHNDWVLAQTKVEPDRLRLVAILWPDDVDAMMAEAERLFAAGVRSLFLPASEPFGGESPASPAADPFWSLCEEADASVMLHVAVENFLHTDAWRKIPQFQMDFMNFTEFPGDPWSLSTVRLVVENYLSTLVLGGVFERHPSLRFGVIECGSNWVGPLAENLDMWASQFPRRMNKILSMPPSAYFPRNIRVSSLKFEKVATYIDRYGLEDVFCYSSDHPHAEGGSHQLETLVKEMTRLGDSVMEKFFVTNADLLMPPIAV